MPVGTPRRRTYIRLHDKLERLPEFLLVHSYCMLGCGTLGYLVLTAQTSVFSTHYGTGFHVPKNMGIHPVMPDLNPTATI